MKLKHSLTIFGLVAMLGLGVGVGLASANQEVKVAEATGEKTIYLYTNNEWEAAEPTVKVRLYNTSTKTNDYVVAQKIATNYYYAEINTTNHNGYQFQRFSTDGTEYWNGYSSYCTNFSNNFCSLTSYTYDGDNGTDWSFSDYVAKDESILANVDAVSSFWYNDECSLFLWMNGPRGQKILSMSRVGNSNLLKATASTGGVFYTQLVVLRGNAAFNNGGSPDWSKCYNQSIDLYVSSSDLGKTAIYVLSAETAGKKNATLNNLSDAYLIDAFGNYFLSATTGYCGSALTTEQQTAIKNTLDAMEAFEVNGVRTAFANGEIKHTVDGHSNKANEAVSRYWNMTHEADHAKGSAYGDFLELGGVFMARSLVSTEFAITSASNSNTLIIIIAASVVTLVAIGGYFYLRKRKEDR